MSTKLEGMNTMEHVLLCKKHFKHYSNVEFGRFMNLEELTEEQYLNNNYLSLCIFLNEWYLRLFGSISLTMSQGSSLVHLQNKAKFSGIYSTTSDITTSKRMDLRTHLHSLALHWRTQLVPLSHCLKLIVKKSCE